MRKELGEERKIAFKLEKKLTAMETDKKSKPVTSKKKLPKKNTSKSMASCEKSEKTCCSICNFEIPHYIPEYFMGEKYNPACHSCKSNDSSWDPGDPFSSFPSPSQPVYIASHWILPPTENPSQNPSSITSLIPHCVKFPNPGNSFISIEEALVLLKKMFEERLSSLR